MHTNTDVLDAPAKANEPKRTPAIILRPLISLLAHACRPSCYLEPIAADDLEASAGAARLHAASELRVGDELTRCYAGCLRESAEAFASCPLEMRTRVLRKKGFHFECVCTLCVEQRASG